MDKHELMLFHEAVWGEYQRNARASMPWRNPELDGSFNPYKIMVSEIMLQQTQVGRVAPKYQEFLELFPDIKALATAELGEVLRAWQGLGYNRRAKFLWQAAHMIDTEYNGIFPHTITELVKLPGVGKNTAAAIIAYTWSIPVVYIETNIRTVYIYHFFAGKTDVTDTDILQLVTASLPEDSTEIREWYWALMDYGASLKKTHGNLNKLSKTYSKQSKFNGSLRQIRGAVLRALTTAPYSLSKLSDLIADDRLQQVLNSLEQEQLITRTGTIYSL